jgi:hypothetical protein
VAVRRLCGDDADLAGVFLARTGDELCLGSPNIPYRVSRSMGGKKEKKKKQDKEKKK